MKPLKEISFKYKCWCTTNKLKNAKHIWTLNKLKDEHRTRCRALNKKLMSDCQFNSKIDIVLLKRDRSDADGAVGGLKFYIDSLMDLGILNEDNKHHVRSIKVVCNDTLPYQCYVVRFYLADNDEDLSSLSFPSF